MRGNQLLVLIFLVKSCKNLKICIVFFSSFDGEALVIHICMLKKAYRCFWYLIIFSIYMRVAAGCSYGTDNSK